jgi:predicted transposase/invertase (TIGR01784 family)
MNTSIHDNFIRAILSDKNVAEAYFENFLPDTIKARLDFPTLTQVSGTYISKELRTTMSDIIYNCQVLNSNKKVKLSLLIEHKSYPDKYTLIQIGCYIFSALQKQIEAKEPLNVVIPILLYHGKGQWQHRTMDTLFEGLEAEWLPFIPVFSYIYNDLGELSDEQLGQLHHSFLKASVLALKHSADEYWLVSHALNLLTLTIDASEYLQTKFLLYLLSRSNMDDKQLKELIEALPDQHKNQIMTTAERLFQKGKAEGITEGSHQSSRKIALAMLNDKMPPEQVSKFTGLSLEELKQLQQEQKP